MIVITLNKKARQQPTQRLVTDSPTTRTAIIAVSPTHLHNKNDKYELLHHDNPVVKIKESNMCLSNVTNSDGNTYAYNTHSNPHAPDSNYVIRFQNRISGSAQRELYRPKHKSNDRGNTNRVRCSRRIRARHDTLN